MMYMSLLKFLRFNPVQSYTFLCILKAWAVFKGKYKEGDKAEPATWKTRLRCALNKSPDFEEVTERSQLDISEPYKVYRIVPEEEQKREFVLSHSTRHISQYTLLSLAVSKITFSFVIRTESKILFTDCSSYSSE